MANADQVQLSIVPEVTYGVTPTGTYPKLRFKDEDLKQETASTASQEITPDRQVPDLIRTGVTAQGPISFEFSYGAFDSLLQYSLCSAGWSSAVNPNLAAIVITAVASGNKYTRPSGSWISDGLILGQWVKVGGYATNAGNNGVGKITAITATDLTISGLTLVDEAGASGVVTVSMAAQIVNGTTLQPFSIEKWYTDKTGVYSIYPGSMIDGINLDVAVDAILQGGVDILGKKETPSATSPSNGTTSGDYSNAPTNPVMNAIDHVLGVFEGGTATDVTRIAFALANNLRARKKIGTLGAISLGAGKIAVSGTLEAYFDDNALVTKYVNFTATSLAYSFRDELGNRYVIEFPRVRFSTGGHPVTGENTDVMQSLDFTATKHSTEGITIRISRWPA